MRIESPWDCCPQARTGKAVPQSFCVHLIVAFFSQSLIPFVCSLCPCIFFTFCRYELALRCLTPRGGWLHVHANVRGGIEQEQRFASRLVHQLKNLAEALHRSTSLPGAGTGTGTGTDIGSKYAAWQFRAVHISRVKWYAPLVRHVVVDVLVSAVASPTLPVLPPSPESSSIILNPSVASSYHRNRDEEHEARVLVRDFSSIRHSPTEQSRIFWEEIFPAGEPCVLRGLDLGS